MRRVSKEAPASANSATTESFPSTSSWRWLLPQGVGAVAVSLAASLTLADASPAAGPSLADRGAGVPILSPEAPPSLGDLGAVSPLLAVFNAARGARDPELDMVWLAEPKFDLASATALAQGQDPFGWNRHREERSGAAIQSNRSGPSSLDRFAFARDDDRGSTESKTQERAPPDKAPSAIYDPTAGPPLSPMQSALQAAMERLVARGDRVNPLGAGD